MGKRTAGCDICQNAHPFTIPQHLYDELARGHVRLFAGAGISTESPLVLRHSFYTDVADELGISEPSDDFPALMTKMCNQPNGRIRLLSMIAQRFDAVTSFPEMFGAATRFHNALAPIFQISTIFT